MLGSVTFRFQDFTILRHSLSINSQWELVVPAFFSLCFLLFSWLHPLIRRGVEVMTHKGRKTLHINYREEEGDSCVQVEFVWLKHRKVQLSRWLHRTHQHPAREECVCVCARTYLCVRVSAWVFSLSVCVCFSMKACCPTNFTPDLREAMRLLISSTEGSSPSDQSNLLLKPLPPETPWKRGDWVTKAMRCDVIYLGVQHYYNFSSKMRWKKDFFGV